MPDNIHPLCMTRGIKIAQQLISGSPFSFSLETPGTNEAINNIISVSMYLGHKK